MLLTAENIVAGYTPELDILKGVSMQVEDRQLISIIGPNGAGKSTLFRTLVGFVRPREGKLVFLNRDITHLNASDSLRVGISFVLQRPSVFRHMTVLENLEMGAYLRNDKQQIIRDIEELYKLFPILMERKGYKAGQLSGGEQRMVEIARALLLHPKLLLLDEPSAALAPKLVDLVFQKIKEVNETGVAIAIVEQNARRVLQNTNYCYVVDQGIIRFQGKSYDILHNDAVKRAYLGM
jgi:ABC-type branched-subunit amino acid transport system ATPase component